MKFRTVTTTVRSKTIGVFGMKIHVTGPKSYGCHTDCTMQSEQHPTQQGEDRRPRAESNEDKETWNPETPTENPVHTARMEVGHPIQACKLSDEPRSWRNRRRGGQVGRQEGRLVGIMGGR